MKEKIERILREAPGLKGREIAKAIGEDRHAVNSFLHKNRESFTQDENYCWYNNGVSELRIELDHHQWVNCSSFENSLLVAESPLDSDAESILFIVPEKCHVLLDAASRLLALCNQLVDACKAVTIDFNDCKSTLGYFDRIGFLKHLDARVVVLPERPSVSRADTFRGNSDTVVEFGSVNPEQSNKTLINQLVDRFVFHSRDDFEGAAFTVFGELINNIKDHSESRLHGFAALQKYEGRRPHIQTVVSDSGLGIATTLKPSIEAYHPNLYRFNERDDYDIKIVTAVMTEGEISRFGAGRGLGFKSSREQAMKFDANLSVRQENFSLDLVYDNGELVEINTHTDLATILGTHLCFDFYVD